MDIMKNIESLIESDISGPMIESATGVSRMTISNYRNKKSDFKKMTLEKAIKLNDYWLSQPGSFTDNSKDDSQKLKEITAELKDMIERLEENKMLKEELQEVLDFIEQDFGALLNDSEINESQVAEFEENGKIKFECYHDKNKYAIVSKDEIELDGFKDHYQTGDFEVYYFESN